MFWKKYGRPSESSVTSPDADEIVSKIGEIYADLNDQGLLVKQRSSLPCSWSFARGCFLTAYVDEYLTLQEKHINAYHHVYPELAFFVDDDLYNDFNVSLNIAARCKSKRYENGETSLNEDRCKRLIANFAVRSESRREILARLDRDESCPREHLLVVAETLAYCSGLYRAMFDEWLAFANLTAFRQVRGTGESDER